jgi:RNA 2',3'-cyclic 3'-phosphodiesterase
MARLFFALWPDEAARGALAAMSKDLARRCAGRPVPGANLHLTLAFLGEVDANAIPALRHAAQPGATAAFELALDQLGAFARAGVAWAGCRQPQPELLALQAGIVQRLREAGFAPDERAFAAHLTLARRIREPLAPEPMEAVRWRVDSFALVESVRGEGAYRTLAEWPLEGGKT